MFRRRTIATFILIFITGAVGCQATSPPTAGDALPTKAPVAAGEQSPRQTPAPVSPADLQAAVMRTYKDAVIIDTNWQNSFVTGDFNGDNSEDIGLIVKPRTDKLKDLNSEYANWILEDTIAVGLRLEQSGNKLLEKSAPVVVRTNDLLLAIIHGYQEMGWRDSKATQTYLLKNAVGDKMETQARTMQTTAPQNQSPASKGDVIRELRDGTPGFIYWTGAKYAWHAESATK